MENNSYQLLKNLISTPSPSGYERPVQDIVRRWCKEFADDVQTDIHGNVIAVLNPGQSQKIMLAGHCDQLALMVQYIDDHGFLYTQPMGGWDMQMLLGSHLQVWTKNGPIHGVIARKAPHLQTGDEKGKVPGFMDVWVDIGVKTKVEAQELVSIGDTITYTLELREMRNNYVAGPGMDDKVGLWTVLETLRLLQAKPLECSVYCVSTVQEEIGLRGATTSAYGIHPTVGIAVDVTHATDTPGADKKQVGECLLGQGPALTRGPNINPHVFNRLHQAAKDATIPIQIKGFPKGTGTDANAIQLSRGGVAAGLVGIPNRYMHSPVEMVNLNDLTGAASLLAQFCMTVKTDDNWTP